MYNVLYNFIKYSDWKICQFAFDQSDIYTSQTDLVNNFKERKT